MERSELLKKIAPCSLMCHTCSAYKEGVIPRLSKELSHYLEGMAEFHKKHHSSPEYVNIVERYRVFEEELQQCGAAPCGGCRSGKECTCSIEGCFLLDCVREHGVDFCGECGEFPCARTRGLFEEVVYAQWLEGNEKIRDLGIEEFFNQNKEIPHYKRYQDIG